MLQPPTPPPITTARASLRMLVPPFDDWYRPVQGRHYRIGVPESIDRRGALDRHAAHARRVRRLDPHHRVLENEHVGGGDRLGQRRVAPLEREQIALRIGLA